MEDISKELISRAAQGEMPAFEQVYKMTSGFVYSVALRITQNRETAQDVTQEVFIKVFDNLKYFQFRSSFKTWVYRITTNAAINAWRRRSKEALWQDTTEMPIENAVSSPPDEGTIDKEDNRRLLDALLQKLNPEQKACIVLREIQGLSYQEIAEVLRININTVRSRLKRARLALLNHAQQKISGVV